MIIDSYKYAQAGLGYGYLYNWYAASHADFAPTNWKVPTNTELRAAVTFLGTDAGSKLAGFFDDWDDGALRNSVNFGLSGFNARPSGLRIDTTGGFSSLGGGSFFINSNEVDATRCYTQKIVYISTGVDQVAEDKQVGGSVRLLWDGAGTPSATMADIDGNVYDVVQIDTQYWTVQNWKCTKLNDGTPLTLVESDVTWAAAGTGDLYYCAYDNDYNNV